MFMLKELAHLALSIFFQFAVVILLNEQSTSIEIYDFIQKHELAQMRDRVNLLTAQLKANIVHIGTFLTCKFSFCQWLIVLLSKTQNVFFLFLQKNGLRMFVLEVTLLNVLLININVKTCRQIATSFC